MVSVPTGRNCRSYGVVEKLGNLESNHFLKREDAPDYLKNVGPAYVTDDTSPWTGKSLEETVTARYVTDQLDVETPLEFYDEQHERRISIGSQYEHYRISKEPDVDPDKESFIDAYSIKKLLGDWDAAGKMRAPKEPFFQTQTNIIVDDRGVFYPIDFEYAGTYSSMNEDVNLRRSFTNWAPQYFDENTPSWSDVIEREKELASSIDIKELETDLENDERLDYTSTKSLKKRLIDMTPSFLAERNTTVAEKIVTHIDELQ